MGLNRVVSYWNDCSAKSPVSSPRAAGVFCDCYSSDKLTTSEWVSKFDFTVGGVGWGGKEEGRGVFSARTVLSALSVLTLSLLSVHLSLFSLPPPPLSPTASISLGWAPAPSVSQQSKHWRLTFPPLSCFSLISCCYSQLFDSTKVQRCYFNNKSPDPIILEVCEFVYISRVCVIW